jgi:hypothetical protein
VAYLWGWDNFVQKKLNKVMETNSQANKIIKGETEKIKNKIKKSKLTWFNSITLWSEIWNQNNSIERKVEKLMKLKA